MKSILIPVEDHALMEAVTQVAVNLARTFDSYIEGVAVGPDIAEFVAADFALSGVVLDERTRRDFVDHSRGLFEGSMSAHHVGRARADLQGPQYGWSGRR